MVLPSSVCPSTEGGGGGTDACVAVTWHSAAPALSMGGPRRDDRNDECQPATISVIAATMFDDSTRPNP